MHDGEVDLKTEALEMLKALRTTSVFKNMSRPIKIEIVDERELNAIAGLHERYTDANKIYLYSSLAHISQSARMFVLAHEYAHCFNEDMNSRLNSFIPWLSRRIEKRADLMALKAISELQYNLDLEEIYRLLGGSLSKDYLFASHPSAKDRIEILKKEALKIQNRT